MNGFQGLFEKGTMRPAARNFFAEQGVFLPETSAYFKKKQRALPEKGSRFGHGDVLPKKPSIQQRLHRTLPLQQSRRSLCRGLKNNITICARKMQSLSFLLPQLFEMAGIFYTGPADVKKDLAFLIIGGSVL